MKVLITGKNGQLAREFLRQLAAPAFIVEAPEETELDITDAEAVRASVAHSRPDVVLNCAAYNLVDEAEHDPGPAFAINAKGVGHLAAACREAGALLVHYGTDYVFDGRKGAPYTEEDEPRPLNNYGRSKLAGEEVLLGTPDRFLILRVSWVFGLGKQNFLHKILRMAETRTTLRIVDDQTSTPTSTAEIVRLTVLALEKGLRGLFHATQSGHASRFEVARYLLSSLGLTHTLIPVSSDYFPSPAERPRFSALSNAKLAEALRVEIPDWKSGIDWYLETLKRGTGETVQGVLP